MKAFKGFTKDLKCRDFQYEIGKEYEESEASICNKGFHACEYPLDCFNYYAPSKSRFCEVEINDNGERRSDDTKVCGNKIKIGAELNIKGLIKAAFEYTKERCTNTETGGDSSALTGGDSSALTGGDRSALTGGDSSALTGGDSSALTGGSWSALTGGSWSALTGGDSSALTGGSWSVLYGGEGAKVRGGLNAVLALQYWKYGELISIKCKVVDGVEIKENTYYTLDENGQFARWKNNLSNLRRSATIVYTISTIDAKINDIIFNVDTIWQYCTTVNEYCINKACYIGELPFPM